MLNQYFDKVNKKNRKGAQGAHTPCVLLLLQIDRRGRKLAALAVQIAIMCTCIVSFIVGLSEVLGARLLFACQNVHGKYSSSLICINLVRNVNTVTGLHACLPSH